jgi:SAM-dependent methyltransferase
MSAFGLYAKYYDLLYRDKDYAAEAAFVARLMRPAVPDELRVLEIGCGTGAHAVALAKLGYEVTGIDLSESMLAFACERRTRQAEALQRRLRFLRRDGRSARLGEKFEAVIALFHVVSYQTSEADLASTFATAAAHMRPGASFIFDFWYGPAVLGQRPEIRVKHMEDEHIEVARTARPTLREASRCVDVDFTIVIRDKATGAREQVSERHTMRYFFIEELAAALARSGLSLVEASEMQTGRPATEKTWSVCASVTNL